MPRKPSPPRLYLRPDDKTWVIRDHGKDRRTGCAEGQRDRAEIRLAEYLAEKHVSKSAVGGKSDTVSLAEVMRVYVMEHAPSVASPHLIAEHIEGLTPFWGTKKVSAIKGSTCREFTATKTESVGRRQLETLRAAVKYFHKEYGLDPLPSFTLPPKPEARERWLTRKEAATLLRAARGLPHLQRFILVGLYTGTRSAAILGLQWDANTTGGWIDLDRGVMYRKASGRRKTKKLQPPVRLASRLLAHMRRWKRQSNIRHVVHWNGSSVLSIKKAFRSARKNAKLDQQVIPHSLRHTAATWLMLAGVDIWEAAGFLGMSAKVLEENYGHFHPDFQGNAAEAIGRA